MINLTRSLVLGCSVVALAACGPDDIASPGTGGNIDVDINNPPAKGGGDGGNGAGGVTPAAGCPTVGVDALADNGTIAGPTGTWRVCALPQVFTDDATLPQVAGVLYSLPGRVDVGVDDGPLPDASDGVTGTPVTLTIEPGVTIFAATGRAWLAVNRGSKLMANGTAAKPIVFTSRDNVQGLNTVNSSGQWGGVVLMGRAPVSDCDTGTPTTDKTQCEMGVEGALSPAQFGGPNSADSSGEMSYVQLRYSGFVLSEGKELQSLTTGGVGSGTVFNNIMSYNSSDDGMEAFGGVNHMTNFIVVGAEDDSFDIDSGAQFTLQNGLAIQRASVGDNLFEIDSPDADYDFTAAPQTNVSVTNFVGHLRSSGAAQAIRVRGRANYWLSNAIVVGEGKNCARIDEETPAEAPKLDSVLFQCTVAGGSDVAGYVAAGSNNNTTYTNTLVNLIVNGGNESGAVAFDPTAMSTLFTNRNLVGIASSSDTWFQGWACDSATASFASTTGSCLSLPVYN